MEADSIFHTVLASCPERLKKAVGENNSPNEISDILLKFLGDTGNDSRLANAVTDLLFNIISKLSIQSTETEFAILSLQNIFITELFEDNIKSKILVAMVSIFLTQDHNSDLQTDLMEFLFKVLSCPTENVAVQQTCIECFIEIGMTIPAVLEEKKNHFINLLSHVVLGEKTAELLALLIKNTSVTQADYHSQLLVLLLDKLPTLNPMIMASVAQNIIEVCKKSGLHKELDQVLERLLERYQMTSDLCILRVITVLQEIGSGITKENPIICSATHPGLTVARNLIALDWLAHSSHLQEDSFHIELFEPTPYDGADARLKKMILLNKVLRNHAQGSHIFRNHLEQFKSYAIQNKTSRAIAAVFRVLKNMLETDFPANSCQITTQCVVEMATKFPSCLPHVVDFLKFCSRSNLIRLSHEIILGLIDSYDDMERRKIEPNLEFLLPFFIEASTHSYEFCQPRIILRIIRRCLETTDSKIITDSSHALAVVELCQALIRNQDYEIFQPELNAILSVMETSHKGTDIKHRTWMLRSLITHVNTDSLKDAFDVDMDLSKLGQIEYFDSPIIEMKILLDDQANPSQLDPNWSLERKRISRSIYFPLEIKLPDDLKVKFSELIGVRIDFALDPSWGQADPIYLPILTFGQVKKSYIHVQPQISSSVYLRARATASTTDGRIFSSHLGDFHLHLEHILCPLFSATSLTELWDCVIVREGFASSILSIDKPDKLLSAVESGTLKKFQDNKKHSTFPLELALVTPDSLLILVRARSFKDDCIVEILVEDISLLSVTFELLSGYTK